ncbi:3'(2'),5'-bisphosphate nucleotidase CysQ [Croceicoccus sp. F390]|uniref:3'(2'),5'-bisphosphate nucleotidase CysQ n=1 Tax=Croceicoccus esteveae TaxID=3075597 RepID=A0ABU2ZGS8_9SPHN|nr:3'(2'),5'-bisphosphate nucleotidase CysQ [Croceicoccus sp. F390]MDT0575802.1 3'(2'),5'-bisphosphate nucleotidase CysQ [Croceicoccus sp. F390]
MLDREELERIVREAGRIGMGLWPGAGHAPQVWDKPDKSPVSAADMAVDTFLRTELSTLVPQAGWLSEETEDTLERLGRDLIWLVDPIDGTRDFLRGRDGWAVSVALIKSGQPLIASLYAPAKDEFWSAERGQGARRNGDRLRASRRAALSGSRMPADLPIRGSGKEHGFVAVAKPNSIALRIAMVAADEADLVGTTRWGHEWDLGAACLIASEAGAIVTDACGDDLVFNKSNPRILGVLAAASEIHSDAARNLKKALSQTR